MIGVVIAGAHSERSVLGLAICDRAVLSLQSAGVDRVLLIGPHASTVRVRLLADVRCRVPIDIASAWPAGGAIIVDDGVAVDARAIREVAAAGDLAIVHGGRACVVRTDRAGDDLVAAAEGPPPRSVEGVVASVTTSAEAGRATAALLASLRKPQDGWVSRLLNRTISLSVTRVLVWLPIRPNVLTLLILAIGLAGAWFASFGERIWLAVGGVLFQLQSILDGCDGELSRLTFRGSKLGEWLDTIGDDVTNYAFFAGAACGLHRAGLGSIPLAIGAVGLVAGLLASGIEYAYLIGIGSGDLLKYPLGFGADPEPRSETSPLSRFLGAIRPAFKRDFFVFLAMIMACAGHITTFIMLLLFAGGAIATLSAVIASEIRRRRVAS